ncbi:helix-turn-helix domain-containing protein [Streptomyces sp. NPDC004610]|uniref:GlxA family transcriptional regulator n=1 Tax=unclassified Streptomyces TaxID=2593676 RepID=UPI0033BC1D16
MPVPLPGEFGPRRGTAPAPEVRSGSATPTVSPARRARRAPRGEPVRRIALLVRDGVPGHQLTTPGMVLEAASRSHPAARYDLRICAPSARITTAGPLPVTVTVPWGTDALAEAGTVILTGHDGFLAEPPPEILGALRAAASRGARIAAVGTGVFTLAATGLLDGHRATTEWAHIAELDRRHPRVTVDPAGTLAGDGPYPTTAGVFGGVDLLLHLIARDHGPAVAARTARGLIAPMYEHAGATRDAIDRELTGSAGLEPALRLLESDLDRTPTLAEIAAHAGISVSAVGRRFRERTGLTPHQYLLRVRLERARRLLEDGDDPIERIAATTGFGSPAVFRRHFHRLTGTTPRAYRAAHRRDGSG